MEIRLPTATQSENILRKIQYPDNTMKLTAVDTTKKAIWYDTTRKIVYATAINVPLAQRTKLFASYDFGETWQVVYESPDLDIRSFYTLRSGNHLMNVGGNTLRRVDYFFNTITHTTNDVAEPLTNSMSIDDNGSGVIMYAEYGTIASRKYRILKSVDDGRTWTTSEAGLEVRHWHSLQIDPYTGHWWACGGDNGDECRIIMSTDNGATWQIKGIGGQTYRAIGLAFFKDEVIWGMDSAATAPDILKAKKDDFVAEVIAPAPFGATVFGVAKTIEGTVFGWSRVEVNGVQRETVALWICDGNEVKVVQKFSVRPNVTMSTSNAGIQNGSLVDNENRWFCYLAGCTMSGSLSYVLPVGVV